MKLPIEYIQSRRNYLLFKNDTGVTDMARRGAIYEHYIFDYCQQHLNLEGKNVIDIGANFGFHTLEFADFIGQGHIYAFEPQKLVYYQLCGNIIANGLDNVTAFNVALGDKFDTLKVENPDYHANEIINIGNSHLNAYTHINYNWVDVKTLDSYNYDNVGMMKIDVQGYEPWVLDGAKSTILRNRPTIFIEVEEAQLHVYNFTSQDIFTRLDHLGYKYWKLIDAPHLVDYVAVPLW